jgi:predicted ArsR family transcriptional regulator
MQTTRQNILSYLEKHRQATAPELAQVLDLTSANIRHHLDILAQDGKVEVIGETPVGGRGRPTMVYMVARTEQANALDTLSSLLLRHVLDNLSEKKQTARLSDLADRFAGNVVPGGSITIRLSTATRYLNDFHYKAHWEAHADAPYIFLGNCPFSQIITQHPELCQMDQLLIERLTGERCIHVEKQSRSLDGPGSCRFKIE